MLLCILFGGRETVESFNIEPSLAQGTVISIRAFLSSSKGVKHSLVNRLPCTSFGVFLQVCCVEAVVFSFVDVML